MFAPLTPTLRIATLHVPQQPARFASFCLQVARLVAWITCRVKLLWSRVIVILAILSLLELLANLCLIGLWENDCLMSESHISRSLSSASVRGFGQYF